MGQINQPSNLLDRIKRAEQQIQRLWKSVGLASATISRGGLTLLQDAFLRMVDDNDTEVLYFGPDTDGRQIMRIRREDGSRIMFTGKSAGGRDFWALADSTGRIVASDDAATGKGLARPWLPVQLYQHFVPRTITTHTDGLGEVYGYSTIDAAKIGAEVVLWEGNASVSHPWLTVFGVWGRAAGTPNITYRLKVDGVQVGSWSPTVLETSWQGAFDVSAQVGTDWVPVSLTVSTTGTGVVACQVLGCYLHQTM
ncbi:hypothetical protein SAMN05216215_11204 [Saccharopolyspora shandongensis]|uniref:Uncharacterized protein n=1 Tax=Saccharopolyspora shandongensis TaxID=418495 RepID=A0A1H3U9H5_9PSEU|nr:hypothetical protein [Saccharopolyspora shandongensis]SDZ59064.1 hypothetical protein SAMN05216215_11204 [Saccharopolyspora shandongensis]